MIDKNNELYPGETEVAAVDKIIRDIHERWWLWVIDKNIELYSGERLL